MVILFGGQYKSYSKKNKNVDHYSTHVICGLIPSFVRIIFLHLCTEGHGKTLSKSLIQYLILGKSHYLAALANLAKLANQG